MIPSFRKNSISTSTLKSKWIEYLCPVTVYCGLFFTVVLIITKQNPLNPSKTDRRGVFSFLGNRCYYWIGEKLFEGRTENRPLSSVVPVAQEAICWSSPWSGWDLLHAHAGKSIFCGQGWNTSYFLLCIRGSYLQFSWMSRVLLGHGLSTWCETLQHRAMQRCQIRPW